MSDDSPDFESLRAERNQRQLERVRRLTGVFDMPATSYFDPNACYCACGTGGPCEHKWNGEPYESEDGCTWSATCSRCGCTAMGHSMRVGI